MSESAIVLNFCDHLVLNCVKFCNYIMNHVSYSQYNDACESYYDTIVLMSSLIYTRWWRRDEVRLSFHVNLWWKLWYHKNPLKYRNLKIDETIHKLACKKRQTKEDTSSMICISSLLDAYIKSRYITQYNRWCYRRGYNDV